MRWAKLHAFFSLDMNRDYFSSTNQFADYFKKYLGLQSYYRYQAWSLSLKSCRKAHIIKGNPLVSTFAVGLACHAISTTTSLYLHGENISDDQWQERQQALHDEPLSSTVQTHKSV